MLFFSLKPLINGEHPIPDSAFNATGYLTSSFKPQYSRLNSKSTPTSSEYQIKSSFSSYSYYYY